MKLIEEITIIKDDIEQEEERFNLEIKAYINKGYKFIDSDSFSAKFQRMFTYASSNY